MTPITAMAASTRAKAVNSFRPTGMFSISFNSTSPYWVNQNE